MESYFCEHMAERDLLFHDTVAPHLATYDAEASAVEGAPFPPLPFDQSCCRSQPRSTLLEGRRSGPIPAEGNAPGNPS
jgi:hypothetical protein